jgi:DNA-binding IclR family transcriptional regulator
MVDNSLTARGNFFECATGRVLLAAMDREELARVLARDGQPSAQAWSEAGSACGLSECLATIRRDRLVVMPTAGGAVQFVAVPVDGPDGKVWLALGVSVPTSRFSPARRKAIVAAVKQAAADMASHLALAHAWVMPGHASVAGTAAESHTR